ncbi:hypothetical protein BJ170DRAFT_628640 [Xylariales sp. AK1849]|nr:hypothetical protein BJ170DRAFT_628640 [Xylariales sp. AK1849]
MSLKSSPEKEALKIFLTGVTGYIGGEAFFQLYSKLSTGTHSSVRYALLVRNEERGKLVSEQYPPSEHPNLRLVYGTLDDTEVIAKEAANADIVIHTADSADNEPSARAIASGLAKGHTEEKPGYWVHVSGTSILTWHDQARQHYSQAPDPEDELHDIEDIDRITTLPDQAAHRSIDKLVLAANENGRVRTLIVCPPTIYGKGSGPVNQRSMQVYNMAKFTFEHGYAPINPPGKAEWNNVHIHDLGHLFVLAVQAALDEEKSSNPEIFGPKGYFFLEHGSHVWSEVAESIAYWCRQLGYIPNAETRELDIGFFRPNYPSWVFNSKGVAARARQYLDWIPSGQSLEDSMAEIVRSEAG